MSLVVTVTVRTTPTRLLVHNDKRVVYTILNEGDYDVYVGFDKNISVSGSSKGIKVSAHGGVWSDEYHKGDVWAVASTETEVTVVETSKGG